jgi:RNA-directed DNA polymerase
MLTEWNSIDWRDCQNHLEILQNNLVIATQNGNRSKIMAIQENILRSFSARALAVKHVTTNRGKTTPGIDGVVYNSANLKSKAIDLLKDFSKSYKPSPVKRIYIPKPNSTEKRPLGIPTMFDRCVQCLVLFAYEPIVETNADPRSFGFRKGRSTHDAATYLQLVCGSVYGKRYVLEIDIRKFFDSIDHKWILNNLNVSKPFLNKLLKSGIMDGDLFNYSPYGVPQGGIISPCMANETLDGLENTTSNISKCDLVRFADDFVVVASNLDSLSDAKCNISAFLYERGLTINEDKSCITSIDKGFEFLGFHFKEFFDPSRHKGHKKGIFLVQPTKSSITKVKRDIKDVIRKFPNAKAGTLIFHLNPILRGWSEYYRPVSHRTAFRSVSHYTFKAIYSWILRKHGKNRKRETMKRYFKTIQNGKRINRWVFYGYNHRKEEILLFQIGGIPKGKHQLISISDKKNPFLLADKDYFSNRKFKSFQYSCLVDKRKKSIAKRQSWCCNHCHIPFEDTDILQLHHKKPLSLGGNDNLSNLELLHVTCHRQKHEKIKQDMQRGQ